MAVSGFSDFVKFTRDNVTGELNIGGFAVEVFNAVVKTVLVKPFSFELVPFANPDGTPKGSFDDMRKAVFSKVAILPSYSVLTVSLFNFI